MFHQNRRFVVADIARAGDLVQKFKGPIQTWTLCTGWRYKGWLWLNDSLSENGAQEYAVVKEADMVQWESITVSWASEEFLRAVIQQLDFGRLEGPFYSHITNLIETPEQHGRCHLCM
jgi:hypothetical protein